MSLARKTPAFLYNLAALGREMLPRAFWRWHRRHTLKGWQNRSDADYIRRRVDFYCRLPFRQNVKAISVTDVKKGRLKSPSSYIFDLRKFLRAYPRDLQLNFFPGDTFANPNVPTLIKTRRLDAKTDYGVLFKLNYRRHFLPVVDDDIPFENKRPQLVFRGEVCGKPNRKLFMHLWKDSEWMDIADTTPPYDEEGHSAPMEVAEHFNYQFVLVLEGGDVGSALQWVMASNCVPVMCRPSVEGWLMHSQLVPGKHYIEIASDFSDAEEKIKWYASHPEEAKKISDESKRWAAQFDDKRRESIINYLILDKYFGLNEGIAS